MFTPLRKWQINKRDKNGIRRDDGSSPDRHLPISESPHRLSSQQGRGMLAGGVGLLELASKRNAEGLRAVLQDNMEVILNTLNMPVDIYGNTLLHLAASLRDYTFCSVLLLKGGDPNVPNQAGITPVIIARRLRYGEIYKLLVFHGGKLPDSEQRKVNEKRFKAIREKGLNGQDLSSLVTNSLTNAMNAEEMALRAQGNIDLQRALPNFIHQFPHRRLTLLDAAHLGFAKTAFMSATKAELEAADENGTTPLMKAAARGQTSVVRILMEREVDPIALDAGGRSALVWACLGGHAAVLKTMCLMKEHLIRLDAEARAQHPGAATSPSPLMAAVYGGHLATVELLLDQGAAIDEVVGPGTGKTAVMVAIQLQHREIIDLLLKQGARVEPDLDEKVSNAVIQTKMRNCELFYWAAPTIAVMPPPIPSGGITLKDKLQWFTAEENERLIQIVQHVKAQREPPPKKKGVVSIDSASDGVKESQDDIHSSQQSLKARIGRRRSAFRQGMNLDKVMGHNQELIMSLMAQLPSSGTELDRLCLTVFRCVIQLMIAANKNIRPQYIAIAANAVHHAGEIIEAIRVAERAVLDTRPPMRPISPFYTPRGIFGFSEAPASVTTPSTQTPNLPTLLSNSVSLVRPSPLASSPQSGTAMSATGDPTSMSGSTNNSNVTNTTSTTNTNTNNNGSSMIGSSSSDPHPMRAFNEANIVRQKMESVIQPLLSEIPGKLKYNTRIAIGVWPPPNAVADMVQAAATLAESCKELVYLGNMLGYYPELKAKFDLNVTPYEESVTQPQQDEAIFKVASRSFNTNISINGGLQYSAYKRQKDLKNLEDMSKAYQEQRSVSVGAIMLTADTDQDAEFSNRLDGLLKMFVSSVANIRRVFDGHLKEEFRNACSLVSARSEAIIEEIVHYDIMQDPSDVMITVSDTALIQGLGEYGKIPMPYPVSKLLQQVIGAVRSACDQVAQSGMLASSIWPPPNAAFNMLQGTVPCLQAVRALVYLTKETTKKIRRSANESRRKKEEQRKEYAQTEKIKQMFQMWEDSPESELITPEDEARLFATSLDGLVLAEENGQTVIKGGKLGKLVERLTLIAMPDWDYISAFVMTHHSFTTSFDLLEALINRYETALPPGLTESTFDQFIKKAIVPVRLRVCTVIRMWIEMHFEEDLAVSDSLVMRLQDFIDKRINPDFEQLGNKLKALLDERVNGAQINPLTLINNYPYPGIPGSGVDLSTMSSRITMPRVLLPRHHDLAQYLMTEPRGFMEIDPQELARQLSIMEFSFFQRVKVWECLDQIWGDRRKKEARAYGTKVPEDVAESSGGISSMIKHTNKLTNWIAQVVITADTIKGRINCIKYFVMLAAQCREIRNFNAITAISAGLSQASVGRLKKTWSAFAESHGRTYELYKEISALVSPRGQYAEYRKTLKEMTPPAIPFLGVYLTDLTFIELGNTDFLPDGGYINFEKRRKVAHIIRSIQSYQLHPYHFMPVIAIQEFIHGLHATMSEDEMYEKSLQVEPREDDISDDE